MTRETTSFCDELERRSRVVAEPAQLRGPGWVRAAGERPERAGQGDQGARLGLRRGHALGQGDVVAALGRGVGELAFDELLHRVVQPPRARRTDRRGGLGQDPHRQGEHGVAGKDRGGQPEHRPDGGAVAPKDVIGAK
ncbi:hypothetical protein OH807_31155 [Kitasatospora sp. NBC_01560]